MLFLYMLLDAFYLKELCKKNISPDVVQSYCWPAISRGCDLVAVSRQGDDPLLYIPPLLTFLQFPSVYSFQPKRNLVRSSVDLVSVLILMGSTNFNM